MALRQLAGDGADCSGGNALKGLASQLDRDRSLVDEHRRMAMFGPQRADGASSSLEAEFLQSQFGGPRGPAGPALLPSQLAGMSLAEARAPMPGDWAAEFMTAQPHQMQRPPAALEAQFEEAFRDAQMERAWAGTRSHEASVDDFERIYNAAQQRPAPPLPDAPATWAEEFDKSVADAWADEFAEREKERQATNDDPEQIAALAGQLVSSVTDPKIQQSSFMEFMRKLRDRTVVIDGNKVTEASGAAARPADDWATQFETVDASRTAEWADAFARQQPVETGSAFHSAGDWAGEFEQQLGGAGEDWAGAFERQRASAAEAAVREAVQAHAANNGTQQGAVSEGDARRADWVAQYRQNIEPLRDESFEEWDRTDKPWERYRFSGFGYEGFGREMYSTYIFQKGSEAADDLPDAFAAAVSAFEAHQLGDAILAMESEVRRHPQNARAWHLLGRMQAENENDVLAIAALQKAAAAADQVDADGGGPWIDLAISYANENCRVEAFKALHTWLSKHPRYRSQAFVQPLDVDGHMHDQLVGQFLSAARMGVDAATMDPSIQIALGTLFSMAGEPGKAAECFGAALQRSPDDYALWNRYAATLARSGREEEAVGLYGRSLSINPAYIRARVNLGMACVGLGVHEQALEHLLTALSLQNGRGAGPGASTIWEVVRTTVEHMKRPDLAELVFKRDLGALASSLGLQLDLH